MVIGLVGAKRLSRDGAAGLRAYAGGRMWLIYKYHIASLLFAIAAAALVGGMPPLLGQAAAGHPIANAVLGLGLLHQPSYLNILPLYFLLMAATPFVIAAFERGHAPLVLAASAVLWIAAPISPIDLFYRGVTAAMGSLGIEGRYNQYFNLFAWQTIYLAGLYLGWLLARERLSPDLLPTTLAGRLAFLCLLLTLVLLIYRNMHLAPIGVLQERGELILAAQSKQELSLYVVASFAGLAFPTAWLLVASDGARWGIVRGIGRGLRWITSRPTLRMIGSNSLQTFTTHLLWLYGAGALIAWAGLGDGGTALMIAGGFVAIYAVALVRERRSAARKGARIRAKDRPATGT